MINQTPLDELKIFSLYKMYLFLPFQINFTDITQGSGRSLKMDKIDESETSKIKGMFNTFTEMFDEVLAMKNHPDFADGPDGNKTF